MSSADAVPQSVGGRATGPDADAVVPVGDRNQQMQSGDSYHNLVESRSMTQTPGLAGGDATAGPQLLRPAIAMSWRRSESFGLEPANPIVGPAKLEFDASSRLLQAATPVLDSVRESLSGVRAGGLLADSSGTIVGRFFGDADLAASTDRFGGCLGMPFDESRTGTNAIATCVETREPVTVVGEEHFLECLKSFDCYGLPIINPVTRRLEGVIDLMVDTGFEHRQRRALEVVLDRMVREISMRFLADYDPDVQHSLIAFHALVRRTDDPVVLFGRDFVLHNRRALDELSTSDLSELEQHAMAGGHSTEVRLILESGREVAVQVASPSHGQPALLRVRSNVRERSPVPRTLGRTKSVTDRIDERLDALAARRTPVLVIGERGTGRSRAAHRIAGKGAVVVSAADFAHEPVTDSTAALVIEEADCLSSRAVAEVAETIRAGNRRVVMTTVRDAGHKDIDYLGGLCTEWVELPPLRERTEDVAQIANSILRELHAGRAPQVRLSTPVIDLLRRHRWPGNLAELAAVLAEISSRRSAGDISITDLPTRYQRLSAVRSKLTPFEQAEWQLIERTLVACDGNKVHTAKRLGISRSKLYARLRYFQIT
ncbi:sigma-54-dependent Fis family transcriptional regulator [Rhodococcus wratislaviensis]|uniref:sigma-54-dependent Fis family transcriptional regulator n=1 Tax=Rhodococcus wratislaviensis TaxID=44752 RepID=UPI003654CCEB